MMAKPGYRDPKKTDDQKSMTFTIRLHPESADQAEIALIRELQEAMHQGVGVRGFVTDLYRKAKKMPEKSKPMPIVDTRKIMDKLDKVLTYLKGIKAGGGHAPLPETDDTEYSDDWLSTLDRYLDAGLEGEATDDSSLAYYDDEE
jgi:hypothetical protein